MEFSELQGFVFAVIAAWSAIALLLTCAAVLIAKRQIGRSLHVVRGDRRVRMAVLLACLFVFVTLLMTDEFPGPLALVALGLALAVAVIAPGVEDMVLGEQGARHGWQARNWRQLQGWRLVGRHLRFFVHGELVAVEVPAAMMSDLRAKLEELSPEPESALGSGRDGNAPVS